MKAILVPVDFSKSSDNAALYAANLAVELNAAIILASVLNISVSPQSLNNWKHMADDLISEANERAERLISKIQKNVKGILKISFEVIPGFPVWEQIEQFTIANKISLIVMGTRGASGLRGSLIGSNAAAVIDKSAVPVIAVPVNAKFRPIKKIMYASNMINPHQEVRRVSIFARRLHAEIHVLHVGQETDIAASESSLRRELIKVARYDNIHVHITNAENIVAAVDSFAAKTQCDLLVMFTHRLNFLEKLFGKSVTRHFAFHSELPLLTFNNTNEPFAIMQGWEFAFNFE